MPGSRSRKYTSASYWPGFVDALAALLVVVVFLIMVFALAQVFLSDALSGRDSVLERLTNELDELSKMLDLERKASAELGMSVAQLSSQLQTSISERDALLSKLSFIEQKLESERLSHEKEVRNLNQIVETNKESIELQLRDLERLNRDIEALKIVRSKLEKKVKNLALTIKTSEEELGQWRDLSKALETKLAEQGELTFLAQKEIDKRDIRLSELLKQSELSEKLLLDERETSKKASNQIALLREQLNQLSQQLSALNEALEASEKKNVSQNVKIINLGKRLNAALATRVQELARYRSDFFGRLRKLLGNRSGIRIEGDRFVFQSEVLFASGAAELNPIGTDQLGQLAETLNKISIEIPNDLDWVLRVDGHTDRNPIKTPLFPSNWELSSARSTSVVKYLIKQGVPPNRLVAAGFGEYQPIDNGGDEIAFRRNRRIEFKLTQR
ncbi:MAG: peptidoglycan -binding protein [Alphaproteobacteria bacterium]|nr:peptidoglycan -binding protein [Alphaproteobacteria bacterium]